MSVREGRRSAQWMSWRLTLEELLASIFLKEGFVAHRTVKVVNHQSEDRVNFLLSVSRIMGKGGILKQQQLVH